MGTWADRIARYEEEYGGRDRLARHIRQVAYVGDRSNFVSHNQDMEDASWQMAMARRVRDDQLAELDFAEVMFDMVDMMSNVRFRLGLLAYLTKKGDSSDTGDWPIKIAARLNRNIRRRAEVLGEYETEVDLDEFCARFESDDQPFTRKERLDILAVTEASVPEFILTAMVTNVNVGADGGTGQA